MNEQEIQLLVTALTKELLKEQIKTNEMLKEIKDILQDIYLAG
jgi:hypothetical protein